MDNTKDYLFIMHSMLIERNEERKRIVKWLGKFCAHVDNDFNPLPDDENTLFFQEKMNEQFGWDVDVDAD